MSLPKRFWDKVFINVYEPYTCWTWEAGVDQNGYGRFSLNRYPCLAHRLSFEDFGGITTKELPFVLHKCHEFGFKDNPRCVNPNHLRAGSDAENVKDAQNAGIYRNPSSENGCKQVSHISKNGQCQTCRNIKSKEWALNNKKRSAKTKSIWYQAHKNDPLYKEARRKACRDSYWRKKNAK